MACILVEGMLEAALVCLILCSIQMASAEKWEDMAVVMTVLELVEALTAHRIACHTVLLIGPLII